MALDAATLALCAEELKRALLDARIDKIHQPTRDEVVFAMRSRTQSFRLLMAARSGSARVCLTDENYENPAVPPSFCMLLRKHLTGGRLVNVHAVPGERIVFFDFLCTNEMGDLVLNTLAAELMGRYCNLVLVAQGEVPACGRPLEGEPGAAEALAAAGPVGCKIVDALKRVDYEDSEVRQLLPGLPYTLPPKPQSLDMMHMPVEDLIEAVRKQDRPLPDALRRVVGDVGPVVCREVAHRTLGLHEQAANELSEETCMRLAEALQTVQQAYHVQGEPCLVRRQNGAPVEFSFLPLTQYLPDCTLESYPTFSALLEAYYAEKDRAERLRQKSKDLRKAVQNMYDRALRKQAARTEDLDASEKSEDLRTMGELLTANLHLFKKGDASVNVKNWIDGSDMTIPLDKRLTPSQNAQKFFKEYKKRQTAAKMLAELLAKGEREIEYLKTVLYEVDTASGEAALGEIRAELKSQGYLKYYKQRDKKQKPLGPVRYISSDGFVILVGRNNAQNEKITLKTARGKDLWFHVKNAPGSHVVVMSEGRDIPLDTQNVAAMLAVKYSSQNGGAKVPVDYTEVRNIRKTSDLPPGMVLYEHYETAWITPDETVLATLCQAEK